MMATTSGHKLVLLFSCINLVASVQRQSSDMSCLTDYIYCEGKIGKMISGQSTTLNNFVVT